MLKYLILVPLSILTSNTGEPDPIGVLKKYIQLTGGKDLWKDLRTCRTLDKAWIVDQEINDSLDGLQFFKVLRKWPDKQRIDGYKLKDSTHYVSSIYSKGKGIIKVFVPYLHSIKIDSPVYYDFPAQHFIRITNSKDYFIQMEDKATLEGKDYIVVRISSKQGEVYSYFDSISNMLVYEKESSTPEEITQFSDYRWVDGYLIPFSISKKRNSRLVFKYDSFEIKLNEAISDELFIER